MITADDIEIVEYPGEYPWEIVLVGKINRSMKQVVNQKQVTNNPRLRDEVESFIKFTILRETYGDARQALEELERELSEFVRQQPFPSRRPIRQMTERLHAILNPTV